MNHLLKSLTGELFKPIRDALDKPYKLQVSRRLKGWRKPVLALKFMSSAMSEVSPFSTASSVEATPNTSNTTSSAPNNDASPVDTLERGEESTTVESGHGASNMKLPEDTPKILYRVEYKTLNGETVLIREGKDPAGLLPPKPDKSPVFEILTTVYANTAEKKGSATESEKSDADSKEGKKRKTLPEGFKNSTQSKSQLLTIRSEKLLNALRASVAYFPGVDLDAGFSLYEPYQFLTLHRAALQAYKLKHPAWHSEAYRKECNEDIDTLTDFLDTKYGETVRDEERRWSRSTPVCTFKNLWLLLKPGETCYYRGETGRLEPQITKQLYRHGKGRSPYTVSAWDIDFDGEDIGAQESTLYIHPFDGEKEIASLDYFPTDFYIELPEDKDNHEGLMKERLIARGKKFWDLAKKISHMEYDGKALTYPHKAIKGRIVVDPVSYFASIINKEPDNDILKRPKIDEPSDTDTTGCECEECSKRSEIRPGKFHGYQFPILGREKPPNEREFFFLCTHTIFAFDLKERCWEALDVEFVKDFSPLPNVFDNLVLEERIKGTVEALSRTFTRSKSGAVSPAADFIEGKGEGRIFLLHGPPGVGKTATGEAVAEMTERPLLALTCGDLGTTSLEVEKALENYFRLAESWGAVILLDEADVYLEKRNLTDVKRNSLVSVFLRALEYYRGLLFLTTNRVLQFDEAFVSRIHVALYYKPLRKADRIAIWENNIKRLKKQDILVTREAREYVCSSSKVLDLKWNGREIRNALQTAVSLAKFKARSLRDGRIRVEREDFEEVAVLSAHFQEYMASTHRGKDASQLAKREGLRNDSFRESPKKTRNDDDRDVEESLTKRRAKGRKVVHDDDEEEQEERHEKSKKKSSRRKNPLSSEEDEEAQQSKEKLSKSRKPRTPTSLSEGEESRKKRIKAMKRSFSQENEEEEEKQHSKKSGKSKKATSGFSSSEEKKMVKRGNKKKQAESDEEEEEERPKTRSSRSRKHVTSEEEED
ncbi:MAG: hypothetical protein Q9187_005319 [Circinaria calcarea]